MSVDIERTVIYQNEFRAISKELLGIRIPGCTVTIYKTDDPRGPIEITQVDDDGVVELFHLDAHMLKAIKENT